MRRGQGVIADRSADRDPGMNRRRPALQAMMARAMENIRNAHRSGCRGDFNSGKEGVIVDDGIGQKRLVDSTPAEIQRRRIVQGPAGADSGEQQIVFAIPETVRDRRGGLGGFSGRRRAGGISLLRGSGVT